jgi:hypothetical protein
MNTSLHSSSSSQLHVAWALAGLMRGRYGSDALPAVQKEAENETDSETLQILRKVADCLSR